MASAGPVGPRERDDDAIAVLLNRVEAIGMVSGARGRGDGGRENLTGLVPAASGGRGLPEADQAAPAAPLHRRVDQGDERLDVPVSESLERGTDRIDAHAARLLPAWPPSKPRSGQWLDLGSVLVADRPDDAPQSSPLRLGRPWESEET
jgi:hypothetical protein